MISKATPQFWKRFEGLPKEIQDLVKKNYLLWLANPFHPSLHFKPLSSGKWSVRIGSHYRAVGRMQEGLMIWAWIGTHEEYNHLK